jgi:hypothetical protein
MKVAQSLRSYIQQDRLESTVVYGDGWVPGWSYIFTLQFWTIWDLDSRIQ